MKSIATVLDATHLELQAPLDMPSGVQIEITIHRPDAPARTPPRKQLRHREREQAWRRSNPEVVREYAGQWVVLEGEEIIGHGAEPAKIVQEARNRGIRSPYVFFVEPSGYEITSCLIETP